MRRARPLFKYIFSSLVLCSALRAADAPVPATLPKTEMKRDAAGTITLTCSTPNVLLVYTLDKSAPNEHSSPYLAPIELPHGGAVKARAYSQDRKQKSDPVEATYEPIKPGMPIPPSTLVACTQYREWPGYDWVKRHEEICALVKSKHQTELVMVGDSITHFFGGEPSDGRRPTGPKSLEEIL